MLNCKIDVNVCATGGAGEYAALRTFGGALAPQIRCVHPACQLMQGGWLSTQAGEPPRLTTPRGFEPLRAEPNGFRVHLLSCSDTVSCVCMCAATAPEQKLTTTRREQIGYFLFLLRMVVVVPSVPGNQLSKDFRHRDSNTGCSGEGRVSQPARL